MHDIGRSGWEVLYLASPLLLAVLLRALGYEENLQNAIPSLGGLLALAQLVALGYWVVLAATKSKILPPEMTQ